LADHTGDGLELADQMRRLLYGHLVSRALCAVATLGIPDILAAGPRTAGYLAQRCGAHPRALRQVLRALVSYDVCTEHQDGTFGLTALGATLRSDAVASALPTTMLVSAEIGQAWNDLLTTVRTGHPAFEQVHGAGFFAYLESNPPLRAVFDRSQAAALSFDLEQILSRVDLSGDQVVVDVGGGDGALLEQLLARYPLASGVLIDLPSVAARARERMAAAGLSERFHASGGDFCAAVPAGGDVYLLRQIMHDLDDEGCRALLTACRVAMPEQSTLVIIDLMADVCMIGDAQAQMTSLMDLYMMSLFGTRERTSLEFDSLLAAVGFTVRAVTRLSWQMVAIEASPSVAGLSNGSCQELLHSAAVPAGRAAPGSPHGRPG
jgi:hypothetical protein